MLVLQMREERVVKKRISQAMGPKENENIYKRYSEAESAKKVRSMTLFFAVKLVSDDVHPIILCQMVLLSEQEKLNWCFADEGREGCAETNRPDHGAQGEREWIQEKLRK